MPPRRSLLQLGLCAAAAGPARAFGLGSEDPPKPGDGLVAVDRPHVLLRPQDLVADAPPLLAWPVDPATGKARTSFLSQLLLLRLDGDTADDAGILAFSAICKHASCVVSSWRADTHVMLCPCHGSEYDPAHGGAVVAGPATAALPSLPIAIADGTLRVSGHFSARLGGATGRTD